MIQELRQYSQSFFIKLLLIIICVTFVISFGIGTFGDKKETIAKIDGREILLKDFRKAYQQNLESLKRQFGDNFNEIEKNFNLQQRVFEQLIEKELLIIQAENLNLTTSDEELKQFIRDQKYFQKNNIFDYATYNTVLNQNNILRHDYEDSIRKEIMISKIPEMISRGIVVSESEIDQVYVHENEKIKYKYIEFESSKFLKDIVITDTEISKYYEKNKTSFKSDESFEIDYFILKLNDFRSKRLIKEREIRRYYKKNISNYTNPAEVKARHILLKVNASASEETKQNRENEIKILLDKIKAGEKFEDVAKNFSEDATKSKGGDLGWFKLGEMVPEFEDVAFKLKINQVSEIVKTPFGLHLIKIDDKRKEEILSIDNVRDEINSILTEKYAEKKLIEETKKLESIISENSIKNLAKIFKKTIVKSKRFSQSNNLSELGSTEQLSIQLKEKNKKDVGFWKRNPIQGHVVYEIRNKYKPKLLDLKMVSQEISQKLSKQKSFDFALKTARVSLSKIREGKDIDDIKKKYNLKEKNIEFSSSLKYLPEIGQNENFRSKALSLSKSNQYGLNEEESRIDLIQYLGETLNEENSDVLKKQIEKRLLQKMIENILRNELNNLKKNAKIEILNQNFQPINNNL